MFEAIRPPDTLAEFLQNGIDVAQTVAGAMRPPPGTQPNSRAALVARSLIHCAHVAAGMKAMVQAGVPLWVTVGTSRTSLELATRVLAAHRGIDGWDRLIGYWSREVDNHIRLAGAHIPEIAQIHGEMVAAVAQLPPLQGAPLRNLDQAVREIIQWDQDNPTPVFGGVDMEGFYDTDIRTLHHCTHANLIWVAAQPNEALEAACRNAIQWSFVWLLRAGGDLSGHGDAWAVDVLAQRLFALPAMRAQMDASLQGENNPEQSPPK